MMPDYIHLLLLIPPKYSVSYIMGYLKGKSALMIFYRHANLKYRFGKDYRFDLLQGETRKIENGKVLMTLTSDVSLKVELSEAKVPR